ncbi:MAG: Crp/Fnr family transcriptional regulator [Bacteroidetes bacterium]|jgi:CRP/FNR family transcriptional regulator, polysaccharide utilization system transcription regulator|nr:Crp/Fnr family transcriptional regulator [Bacteroidota bacterium]MBT6687442.1 Crp/Fnr family transcriptional regulator [Bacteroidota bacterium]MBT7143366.1 Crp/Fnr family transcriptional regulator [Bacteroidota bacterium]MBT7491636.1 Crp/Fnr family transcriptional regulator [Bacteroidota bacterium]
MSGIEDTLTCFKNLDSADLQFLDERKTQIAYLKGETIFKQGAFSPHVIFINDGLVRVFLQTGINKQTNIRLAVKGDFMAFSSIFYENIYQYSAIAIKDSEICMIEKEAMKQLLLRKPEFAMQITSRNYQNESRYLEIINNLSYKHMRGKLASAILYLSSEKFEAENVFRYLNRQNIADFASITLESAVKFIKEFEKEEVLEIKGKDILIKNREAIIEIFNKG